MVRMYDRTRPVLDGETDVRVPTPNMATANVRHVPKKSRRRPSQRWLMTCRRAKAQSVAAPRRDSRQVQRGERETHGEVVGPVLEVEVRRRLGEEAVRLAVRPDRREAGKALAEARVQRRAQEVVEALELASAARQEVRGSQRRYEGEPGGSARTSDGRTGRRTRRGRARRRRRGGTLRRARSESAQSSKKGKKGNVHAQGWTMAMRTTEPTTPASVETNMRNESLSVLSMVSMSLEKRFMMRPSGVVSKKLIGARMTPVMAAEWSSREML